MTEAARDIREGVVLRDRRQTGGCCGLTRNQIRVRSLMCHYKRRRALGISSCQGHPEISDFATPIRPSARTSLRFSFVLWARVCSRANCQTYGRSAARRCVSHRCGLLRSTFRCTTSDAQIQRASILCDQVSLLGPWWLWRCAGCALGCKTQQGNFGSSSHAARCGCYTGTSATNKPAPAVLQ